MILNISSEGGKWWDEEKNQQEADGLNPRLILPWKQMQSFEVHVHGEVQVKLNEFIQKSWISDSASGRCGHGLHINHM